MKFRSLFSTALAVTALSIASLAQAQLPANYNHQISGITVQENAPVNPNTFGFTTGSSVTFFPGGAYNLASVRSFSLLYDNNSTVTWSAQSTTTAVGSTVFGAKQTWSPESLSGKTTGWEDSFNAQGSQKPGNIGPNDSTGLVFHTSSSVTPMPMYAGFDLAVFVSGGKTDPFGNGVSNGISTGRVFESFAAVVTPNLEAVPEPGSVALLVGMGVTGGGLLARRRFTRRK